MNGNASLDPDAARSNTIALVVDYPVVFLNLPSNVSALIVETNAGTVDIPREELQSMAYSKPERSVKWAWSDVYAYWRYKSSI